MKKFFSIFRNVSAAAEIRPFVFRAGFPIFES